ncbi:MAG: hypothetical protein KDA21_14085, partial [Phycisphaerales bacterium]|nr:hypothetical protein [Phycisphaerales bacterium]
MIVAGLVSGCQRYQPAPLDLEAHRAALDSRLVDLEPIESFLASTFGGEQPAHFDVADGLSPGEGEVLALFYNAELRRARLDAGVAMASYEHAGLWEDPVFGFDGADVISPAAPFEFGLTLSLTIPISGRLGAERVR